MSFSNGESENVKTPWYIWFWLVSALAIFALASVVIYYRFMTTPETNCGIVVVGNKDLEGCTVIVEAITANGAGRRLSDTFNQGNDYSARFFIPSATYRVELWSKQHMLVHSYPGEFVPPGNRLTLDVSRIRLSSPFPEGGK